MQNRDWHALRGEQALAETESARTGLNAAEAARRLAQYGRNALPPPRRRGAIERFLLQFHNVLIYVLLGAAVITGALGHWVDTSVIVGVVIINAIVGFIQEGKAEQALEAIRSMLSLSATVLRERAKRTVPAEELVPGDIVLLASGDKVPADLRLLETRNLRVEEAALTGESVPVEKSVEPVEAEAVIGDRRSMAYSGTLVAYGLGTGVVVATGRSTELGRISAMIESVETLTTPLLRQFARFGRWLTVATLALSGAAFAIGILWRGFTAPEMFLAAVGIAVALIPEGLPAIVTITLAIGVQRMARRNAIIRRLPAVETLGSVTVICSDKTGTLTKNEMTVRRVLTGGAEVEVEGAGYAPHGGFFAAGSPAEAGALPGLVDLARAALLCNEAILHERDGEWHLEGDPTEGALVTLAMKAGSHPEREYAEWPRLDQIPFESEHRFMATLHHAPDGGRVILVKGAPERVLEMCAAENGPAGKRALDATAWHARMDSLAREGMRVLALASRPAAPDQERLDFSHVSGDFVLLGVVGIIDPPREEAIEAVRRCREAGIRVKMITGDHAVTARAVGAMLGIGDGRATITGAELERLSDEALARTVPDADVFARASPEHKLRLVRALQAGGEVVAMTGDGVNDAPALKRADVGVGMGRKGTEAAKEAAEMVLADDNFASIASAVEEGRTVYDNLKKAVIFILPTNGGEAMAVLGAILAGMTLPISPVQILWVNMVTAVTLSLAFAFEPAEDNVMRRPPRPPREPLISGFLTWRIVFVSTLLFGGVMGLFLWQDARGTSLESARAAAVNALVIGEMVYLFNSRHFTASVLNREGLLGNRVALYAVAILMLLQILFTYAPPMQALFGTGAMDGAAWAAVFAFGAATFALVELEKALVRRLGARTRSSAPDRGARRAHERGSELL